MPALPREFFTPISGVKVFSVLGDIEVNRPGEAVACLPAPVCCHDWVEMMMKKVICLGLALVLTGCATFSEKMVSADGSVKDCSASGGGWGIGMLLGMGIAATQKHLCVNQMEKNGYLVAAQAGWTGLRLKDVDGAIKVSAVDANSSAAAQGMMAADRIVSIDGNQPANASAAQKMLFGKPGTSVRLTIVRQDQELNIDLTRGAFNLLAKK